MKFCLAVFLVPSVSLLVLLRPRSRRSLLWQLDAGRDLLFTVLFSVLRQPLAQVRILEYSYTLRNDSALARGCAIFNSHISAHMPGSYKTA